MTAPDRAPRRYNEEEVGRLLERATEIQRREGLAADTTGGLTLRELEEIAAEAGIDPHLLRRVASELDTGGQRHPTALDRIMGAAPTILYERRVPGQLSPAGLEAIVVEIQSAVGVVGQPSLVGNTLTWRSETRNHSRSLQIVVAPREGETYIRVEEQLNPLAGALFGGIMGGVGGGVGFGVGFGVGLGALGSVLFAAAFPPGVIAASYLAARTSFAAIARQRRALLGDLTERLSEAVTRAGQDSVGQADGITGRLPAP
jgi:hypothetical protein